MLVPPVFNCSGVLIFVLSIKNFSFGLSKTGTHAGVIVFSDYGKYTKMEFDFNKYYNLSEFARHVEKLPFPGYRTRIDLAFDIADQELFTKEAGQQKTTIHVDFCVDFSRK